MRLPRDERKPENLNLFPAFEDSEYWEAEGAISLEGGYGTELEVGKIRNTEDSSTGLKLTKKVLSEIMEEGGSDCKLRLSSSLFFCVYQALAVSERV